ncbi:hypothetical protein CRUP_017473 [Coryphaenoides rupestris]|nr:hypothetical protein CRUP_017473 [Coryphaenoides rupestris]
MKWFGEQGLSYTNWENREPSSGLVPVETCVALHSSTGKWEKVSCVDQAENGVICETSEKFPVWDGTQQERASFMVKKKEDVEAGKQKPSTVLMVLVVLSVVAIMMVSGSGVQRVVEARGGGWGGSGVGGGVSGLYALAVGTRRGAPCPIPTHLSLTSVVAIMMVSAGIWVVHQKRNPGTAIFTPFEYHPPFGTPNGDRTYLVEAEEMP